MIPGVRIDRADRGVDLDFLVGQRGTAVPREAQ